MPVKVHKHFDPLTPFSEAADAGEMATILRLKYPEACTNLKTDAGYFARMIEEIRQYRAYESIGYNSFKDFCADKLGKTIKEVEQIVGGVKVLAASGIDRKVSASEAIAAAPKLAKHGEVGNGRRGDNVTSKPERGNRQSYLAARLRRDHPEIAKKVEQGRFKSIRAAAIEAGIIKVKTPYEQLMHWWQRADDDQRQQFLHRVAQPNTNTP